MQDDRNTLVLLTDAIAFIPVKTSRSTLEGWVKDGIRGVKLAVTWVGGRKCTSRAALDDFFAAVTAARAGKLTPEPSTPDT